MRKRFTKIICCGVAAISALSLLAFAPACSSSWKGVAGDKDTATEAVKGTNGGFLTQTEDYVYFINGKAANTDDNKFGKVVKGSVQRIKKEDIDKNDYANTQTVVPSVIYSGNYNAGLYIYGGYLYYTTPTTDKNVDGDVLNSNLDFKRTKLDGTDTTKTNIWRSSDNAVDYRYVCVDGKVYIIYALSESLYGTSATNIHSVDCESGTDTLLAYNVESYSFDTEDPENPYIYYTMKVPQFLGDSTNMSYNQLYRVRADVKESPRTYDFSGIEDYDAEKDPVYINYGDFVFDGIGKGNYATAGRLTQLNYSQDAEKYKSVINYDDYTYAIKWYKNGTLYFTRKSNSESSATVMYTLTDKQLDDDNNGRVDDSWDAVAKNTALTAFIYGYGSDEYTFVEMKNKQNEKVLYAISATADGIKKCVVANGAVDEGFILSNDASATVLDIREENGHVNLYYSITGGNGYTVNRIAIDGDRNDYRKLSDQLEPDMTYRSVKILDLDVESSWYMPEFVGNKYFFASDTAGMTSYNYIMVCDLSNAAKTDVLTNNEIKKLNEKYEAVTKKIDAYSDELNADGSQAYSNLAGALKYRFYTRDGEYLEELIQAYVDVEGRDKEYLYSEKSVQIYKDFGNVSGDWASYAEDFIYVNGYRIYANTRDYYYTNVGPMTEDDAKGLIDYFKGEHMKAYPVDSRTWYQKLSTGEKVGFIIGMVAIGLLVVGGVTFLTIYLVRRHKRKNKEGDEGRMAVDITDDKNINVYGDDENQDKTVE